MKIMEAIGRGFGIATKNLGLVLVLFVFNVIWAVGSLPLINPANVTAPITAAAAGLSILFILASIFVQGGTLGAVRDYIKTGSMKLSKFASYGLKYYLRLFLVGLIIVAIVGIVALLAATIIAATAPLNKVAVTIAAATVAVIIGVVGLYFVILFIMAPYSLVCDEAGVGAALKSSMNFVKKVMAKVLLLLVLLILISLGIGFLVGFLTGLATIALPAKAGQIVIGVVNSIFNGYLGVVMIGSFMTFYLGLLKKEQAPPASIPPQSASI